MCLHVLCLTARYFFFGFCISINSLEIFNPNCLYFPRLLFIGINIVETVLLLLIQEFCGDAVPLLFGWMLTLVTNASYALFWPGRVCSPESFW